MGLYNILGLLQYPYMAMVMNTVVPIAIRYVHYTY